MAEGARIRKSDGAGDSIYADYFTTFAKLSGPSILSSDMEAGFRSVGNVPDRSRPCNDCFIANVIRAFSKQVRKH